MSSIMNSELVTNSDGCVYHLNLLPEHLADTVILVGDPNRVPIISSYFDKIEVKRSNRELNTHTGMFGNKRISVVSTGMGTDNIDIVLTELDILANFDLKTKTLKDKHKTLNLIRIGTCGALQPDVDIESVVMTYYSIGLDGLLYFYDCPSSVFENELKSQFVQHVGWSDYLPHIYSVKVSDCLAKSLAGKNVIKGITLSAPGFYGPQGRAIHLPLKYPKINELVSSFSYKGYKVLNYEMESSAIYGLGRALGHNVMTMCLVIANRTTGKFSSDYHDAIKKLTNNTLQAIAAMP